MLGFGHAFFTLIGEDSLSLHDDEPDNVRSESSALCSRMANPRSRS